MGAIPITPRPEPTGSKLVRLRDLDRPTLLAAARRCADEAHDPGEAATFLALAISPGDKGGRVAA